MNQGTWTGCTGLVGTTVHEEQGETSEVYERERIEFLKYALAHIEARTSRTDSKASVLAALVGALSAFFVYEITEVTVEWGWPRVIVVAGFCLAFVDLVYLARVIRPFGHGGLQTTGIGEKYVMWFHKPEHKKGDKGKSKHPENEVSKESEFPGEPEQYAATVRRLGDPTVIRENLEEAYYVSLQIIKGKYKHLRRAVWLLYAIVGCAVLTGIASLFV